MNLTLPVDHPDLGYFWRGVLDGRLLLRRCTTCRVTLHPALSTPLCATCFGTSFEEFAAAGTGTVYTWICVRHPGRPDDPPRIAALIELAEGVRIVSNVIDVVPDDMRNGMPVEVRFVRDGAITLPQFAPDTRSAA